MYGVFSGNLNVYDEYGVSFALPFGRGSGHSSIVRSAMLANFLWTSIDV